MEELRRLPYQQPPYAARNWGHPFHSMCSYPSKLKPAIAHFLVKLFTAPGETVLDPFSGVGTIPFEACNQGRIGLGSDLNPLAAVVTAAKVRPPTRAAVEAVLGKIAEGIERGPAGATDVDVDEELASFFHPRTLHEILAARRVLLESRPLHDNDNANANATSLVLACLAHILHGNRPYSLSRRSHNLIPIAPKGEFVYKPVLPSLAAKIERLLATRLDPGFMDGRAALGDFSDVAAFAERVDHVITSPPFLGTTHFVRQNRVRLWLCGWDYGQQAIERPSFLEHQRGVSPYLSILQMVHRVLKPGGRCILHLGVVRDIDMAASLAPHAADHDFSVDAIVYESAAHLESHGRTDRGGTHSHQFLVLTRQ